MRILLVNPNTTEAVTATCAAAARKAASPGTEIVAVTGAFGPTIINTRAENAIAAHALLDALATHAHNVDAVLLAVSYDTALDAARELLDVPVVGMTEAGLLAALMLGKRVGLVTFGTAEFYREMVIERGLERRFAGIVTITATAIDATRDPDHVQNLAVEAVEKLVRDHQAEAAVLAGAAMAGMPAKIAGRVAIPTVDGIAAGVAMAEMLARMGVKKASVGSLAFPGGRGSKGLSSALTERLAGKRVEGRNG